MGKEYVILNLGQSNAEPKASLATYFAAVPDMNYGLRTPDATLSIYYGKAIEAIRFLTFYIDESSASYPGGSPPSPFASLGWASYCKFLPWTGLQGASNPNPTPAMDGFRYPNAFCVPLALGAYGSYVNSVVDLARRMHGHLKQRINVITMAVDSSQLQYTQTPVALTARAWFDPRIHNNWAPGIDGTIFSRLRTTLEAAVVAAAAENNTLEIILVTMKQGEADVQNTPAAELFPTNAPAFVDAVRALIVELGLSSVPASQIPFVWPKIPPIWGTAIPLLSYPGYPSNLTTINETLQQLHDDDPYFQTYEVSSFISNDIHYDATGIQLLADADFKAWMAISSRATASFSLVDVPTLSEVMAAVRRVTERGSADSGQQDADVIEAINEAFFDLLNFVGDTAWWTRLTTPWTLTSDPQTPVQLPRCVTRLLEIRPTSDPWATIDTSLVRHADNGRVEIITLEYWSGQAVELHHQYEPRRVSVGTERLFIPRGYVEAVKIGAARRMAANAGNVKLRDELRRDEERLKMQVSQHSNKVDRQRRQRLSGRRGTRYRRSLGSSPN